MGPSQASSSRFLAVLGFFIFVAVVFVAAGFRAPLQSFFAELISSRTDSPYASLSRSEVEERLRVAEDELTRIQYQSVLYELLAKENTSLRTPAFVETITTPIAARVLSRPPRTHYDTLILGVGSASGIAVKDLVVFNGVLLGEIISVTASSATAELFSTPASEHDVILGTPTAVVIARGLGGGALEMEVPQGVEINAGDVVRASTDETLIFGVVVSLSGSPTDATKTVHASVPVSMNDLDFVTILPQSAP
ncbi:hypothetical protein K2X83_00340 [Patescibacteria group bacterium]|nr:hypothetical protein [Patescibacteria group bacterium]